MFKPGRTLFLALSVVWGVAAIGCGGDDPTEAGPDDAGGVTPAGDGAATAETDGPVAPTCGDDASDEDFLAVFGYRYRVPGPIPPGKSPFDMQMMHPIQKEEPVNLTDFLPSLGCEYGCLLDERLRFVAINSAPPDQDGFDFQIGLVNSCLGVQLKGLVFENKADFAFAGHFIYYSERKNCNGPTCQYSVTRVDLDNPTDVQTLIPFFPPPADDDWINGDSTYKGHFQVSPDGESLVLLSPTIRSQRVYLWTAGTLHEVDYLCDNFQNGKCIGAGSNFSDNDPVAISPDSKSVVLFTVTDRALRVRRYSTENPNDKGSLTLLSIPPEQGAYNDTSACIQRLPWQFTKVVGQPAYTPDGAKILFIGRSDCTPGADKPETDIYWIEPSRIDRLAPLGQEDLFNVTHNDKGPSAVENLEITALAVAPDGKRVLYSATPRLSSNWKPLKPSDGRGKTDHELYMSSICGGDRLQLTSDVAYEATSPSALVMPDISKCPGHPLAK